MVKKHAIVISYQYVSWTSVLHYITFVINISNLLNFFYKTNKLVVYNLGIFDSSEIRGFCSNICPREMVQNMLCLCKKKTQVVAQNPPNEKRKILLGFSFYINIANFEPFLQGKKLSKNLFFLKSDLFIMLDF